MLTKREEVGLHESLLPIQQTREIYMVALIVDPFRRCLVINGELPMSTHKCVGCCSHEGILPFVTRLVGPILQLRSKRVHQIARVYDPFESPVQGSQLYIVARVDVFESQAVPGGEWLASAERASEVGQGDETVLKCAQLFLGEELAWKSWTPVEADQNLVYAPV